MFARTPIEFLQCVVFVSHVSVALMCCLSLFRHFRLMSEETSPLLTKFAPTMGSWSKPVFGESLGALLAWMVLIILFIMVILQCTRFCRDTRTPINMDKSPIGRAHCASGQATGLYGIKKKWLMIRLVAMLLGRGTKVDIALVHIIGIVRTYQFVHSWAIWHLDMQYISWVGLCKVGNRLGIDSENDR